MAKLSKKELESIQKLMNDFNQVKMQLGDTVITQHSLMSNVEELKVDFSSKVFNPLNKEVPFETKATPDSICSATTFPFKVIFWVALFCMSKTS